VEISICASAAESGQVETPQAIKIRAYGDAAVDRFGAKRAIPAQPMKLAIDCLSDTCLFVRQGDLVRPSR
jgi:hypothetical protein